MKRVTGFLSTAVFFTAVLLAALAGTGAAQTAPTLDHFYCYIALSDRFQTVNLSLEDQFDVALKQTESVKDLRIVRFCNPVQKKTVDGKVTPIKDADGHLAIYLINPQPTIPRLVLIRNQFGRQVLRTGTALLLAVPSGKSLPGQPSPQIPTDLDHFKCYLASGREINRRVLLNDQFSTDSVLAGVLQPILFCNPVKKTIPTPPTVPPNITPITNPNAHLACYVTTRRNFQTTLFYRNQFSVDPQQLLVSNPDFLCVPSLKLRWVDVQPPSSLVP